MIDAIELTDWEGHKHSLLELDENVTVITGKSHNGKSSIIRAIDWVLNNRPVSTAYFPRGKKKPESTVSISTEDGFISRIRNKQNNFYETDDGVFTALRSGVPDEVKDFLGMTEINLQLQKDVHFMLTDTAGKRAKQLNEIAGLSEMDTAIEKINRLHRAVNAKYDTKTTILSDLEKEYKALEWVVQAQKDLDKALAIHVKRNEILSHIEATDLVLTNIEAIEYQQSQLPNTKAIKDIDIIKEKDDECYFMEKKIEVLEKRLKIISKLKTEIRDVNLPIPDEFVNLEVKLAVFYDVQKASVDLHTLLYTMQSFEDALEIQSNRIKKIETEKKFFMEQFEVCPFCDQEMEGY